MIMRDTFKLELRRRHVRAIEHLGPAHCTRHDRRTLRTQIRQTDHVFDAGPTADDFGNLRLARKIFAGKAIPLDDEPPLRGALPTANEHPARAKPSDRPSIGWGEGR